MSGETFSSRSEAIDFGRDYEYLMPAYYGFKLAFDDDVKDFRVSTNNNSLGSFDDLVIECTLSNGEEHVFAIQLKHTFRTIAQIKLLRGDKFSVNKYHENYEKLKETYTKFFPIPLDNFHFILFTNSTLEKREDFSDDWVRLEPVTQQESISSDFFIRRSKGRFDVNFLKVSPDEDYVYEFKHEHDDSQFFRQFSFFTQQKNAKEMEAFIAECFFTRFENCDSNVIISYVDFFKYWCRGDYGANKLTREDIRVKLAELVLSKYIPEVDEDKIRGIPESRADLFFKSFISFDAVIIDDPSDLVINRVWNIVLISLKDFDHFALKLDAPISDLYASSVTTTRFPLSAYSERFTELTLKKIYSLMWHLGFVPMVVKIDKDTTHRNDILLALSLCENHDKRKKFVVIDEGGHFHPESTWTVFRYMSDLRGDTVGENLVITLGGRSRVRLLDVVNKNLKKVITVAELIRMMDDDVSIGRPVNNLKYNVKRSIPKVFLDVGAIRELRNDLFVVSGNEESDCFTTGSVDLNTYLLLKRYGCHENYQLERLSSDSNNTFVILAKEGCSKLQFEEVCSITRGKNCHHVRFIDDKRVEWIESRFGVDSLREYRLDTKTCEEFVMDEEALFYFNNAVNVICADSGMGKSVLMKVLMRTCPLDLWPVMVCLREHGAFFKEKRSLSDILDHFLKTYDSSFAQKLVDDFASKKQILFLWDGLDELPEESVRSVTSAVKVLAENGYPQWVASRKNLEKFLEDTFNTLSLTLTEFSPKDQYWYVFCYLCEKYEDEEIIDNVNAKITDTLNCGYFDYSGIPLQIHMVAEIYMRQPDGTQDLVSLADIYQQFIEGKFDILFARAGADLENLHMQEIREQYRNSQLLLYERAALKACFDEELSGVDFDCELLSELEEEAETLGLITGITSENKAIFAHKTYEEFLAASWFAKNWHSYPELVKMLFAEKYSNIRLLFDMLLAKDSPLHLAVLYRNLDMVKVHSKTANKCKDRGGRNALHVACSWGRRHPLITKMDDERDVTDEELDELFSDTIENLQNLNSKFAEMTFMTSPSGMKGGKLRLREMYQRKDDSPGFPDAIQINARSLKKVTVEDEVYLEIIRHLLDSKCVLSETDSVLQWSAVQYADQSLSLAALNLINENLQSLKNCNDVVTLLHYSTVFCYDNLFKAVKEIPYVEYKYPFGRNSLLQMACEFNNLTVVTELLKNVSYKQAINLESAFSSNCMSSAVFVENLEMMDVLIDNGFKINDQKIPPLVAAVMGSKTKAFKKLLSLGVDVNRANEDGTSALLAATWLKELEMMTLLLEKGAHVDHVFQDFTPLGYAIFNKDLKTVELLLSYQPDLNYQSGPLGYTPLHVASEMGNIEILKCLLDSGHNTAIKSKKSLTSLQVALANKHEDIALELIRRDPSVVNEFTDVCTSPLMLATTKNFPRTITMLAKHGADIGRIETETSPLFYAAEHQLDSCLVALIEAGAGVNKNDEKGVTPLFSARNHLTTTKILLDNGADLKMRMVTGETVLHVAASSGNVDVVQELVRRGADINARTDGKATALSYAIFEKRLQVIEFLLDQTSVEVDDDLMCEAAESDFPECIPLLIKKGIDVNSRNKNGFTPLMLASISGTSCIKILLENGAVVEDNLPAIFCVLFGKANELSQFVDHGADKETLLRFAATLGDICSLVLILGKGADIDHADDIGWTALHYICSKNSFLHLLSIPVKYKKLVNINFTKEDCAKELLTRGAKIDVKDLRGYTPLHVCSAKKSLNVMKILLEKGADVNAVNDNKQTPLHLCFDEINHSDYSDNVVEMVRLLLANGADPNLRDHEGKTPLFRACSNGILDLVKILHQGGADIFAEDDEKNTLLIAAHEHTPVIQYLIDNDLNVNLCNDGGFTALHKTCFVNNYEGTVCLVENGANIDALTTVDHLTPIHIATEKGHVEIVKLLLLCEANMSLKGANGDTPISTATANNHMQLVKLFAEEFGNLESEENRSRNGLSKSDLEEEWTKCLIYFAHCGNLEKLKFLLSSNLVNVNSQTKKKMTALQRACFRGYYDMVAYLIHSGAHVNAADDKKQTPLHLCFDQINDSDNGKNSEMVRLLLENGADPNLRDHEGKTPLFHACSRGMLNMVKVLHQGGADIFAEDDEKNTLLIAAHEHTPVIQYLIDNDLNVNHCNDGGFTALYKTCFVNNYEGTACLVENGANIDALTTDHVTPIHIAAVKGHIEIVKLLLLCEANMSLKCRNGNTPICTAACNNHLELIKLFVEEFGTLKSKDNDRSRNNLSESDLEEEWKKCLIVFADCGNFEMLKFLLSKNLVDVHSQTEKKMTALQRASLRGFYDMVAYLIHNGAHVNAGEVDGLRPLYYASLNGHTEIVKLLIEHGADVDAPTVLGHTALFIAAANGHLEVVQFLYDKGADVNVVDYEGDTPLHDAASLGHFSVVEFLVNRGAAVKCSNHKGKAPLDLAVEKGNDAIVEFLRNK